VQKILGIVVALVVGGVAYMVAFKGANGLFGGGIESKILPDPALASGWQKVEPIGSGYSFHMPKVFTVFDRKDPKLAEVLRDSAKNNPQIEAGINQIMANESLSLMALDLHDVTSSDAGTNINVILIPKRGAIRKKQSELDAFREQLEKETPVGAKLTSVEFVEMPIGTCIRAEMTNQIQSLSGPTKLRSVSYIAVGKDTLYDVTYTCQEQAYQSFQPTMVKSMETFRIKG
jgi:hypothetical protein